MKLQIQRVKLFFLNQDWRRIKNQRGLLNEQEGHNWMFSFLESQIQANVFFETFDNWMVCAVARACAYWHVLAVSSDCPFLNQINYFSFKISTPHHLLSIHQHSYNNFINKFYTSTSAQTHTRARVATTPLHSFLICLLSSPLFVAQVYFVRIMSFDLN